MEQSNEKVVICLFKEELENIYKEAAAIGAQTAIETLEAEKKKTYNKMVDKRLHNTKLLMRNYHMLKENADNSIFGRVQMEESAADILCSMMNMYDDEVIVDAIKRSASRTAIIVSHIETMLELYKTYCEKSSNELDARRYEVVYDMYISDKQMTVKQIAEKQSMSKENVYSDINIAMERISALIFGIDGLKLKFV